MKVRKQASLSFEKESIHLLMHARSEGRAAEYDPALPWQKSWHLGKNKALWSFKDHCGISECISPHPPTFKSSKKPFSQQKKRDPKAAENSLQKEKK
jgi:hypothetical protein